ncbi:MAG: formyltransferase family protein, partial [Panacagrimonas sp.]
MAAERPDAVLIAAFGALIKEPLLSAHPMLNVHPSLLPRWRGAAPVERAVEAGTAADVPVMVDFGTDHPDTRPLAELVTKKLRPGDIYTHMYSGLRNELVAGKPNPGMLEARARGVIFDVGHGGGSFAWRIAAPAMQEKFVPDSISTDLHIGSMNAGMKDMLNVMSKFLALGLPLDEVDRVAKSHTFAEDRLETSNLWFELARTLRGFPRHLSQHVGGFVISRGPLAELVPIENAAMPERSVIQWDKDDLEALGLLKVDVLALGMLSAIRKALTMIGIEMQEVPAEDPAVYRMIQKADTIGVFQIESRAQMSMLPRLRPASFYDLVIEVAIVRPGPIQGGMVHPYLRRRRGAEAVVYPSAEVERVLSRTLGVPIFQEQVMELAMVAAGFTPGEADRLRRSMAAWKRSGGLEPFEQRLKSGMKANGYSAQFAEAIYRQILGFGEYGFPESHSASFALLVYVSAWIKCHHPAAFCAALLNSQPMGFYAPAQLVQDARRHGVEVRPPDVQ